MAAVGFVLAVVVLGLGFGALERAFPATPGRRGSPWPDLAWLGFGRLVEPVVRAAIGLCLAGPLVLLGLPLEREALLVGHGPVAALPAPLQLLGALAVFDGLSALTHRLHHRVPLLWRVHAVHHSSRHLDWLAAARVHPLNEVVNRLPGTLALLAGGFDLRVVAAVAPLLTLWAIGLHAHVDWRLGPLRFLIATPGYHRWHHAQPPEAFPGGCNFAGLFPVFDLLMGTFHLPPEPARGFGADGVPEGFWGQLLLRRQPTAASTSATQSTNTRTRAGSR